MTKQDDQIIDLWLSGASERRVAAVLGVTRHRVRTAVAMYQPQTQPRGASWVEDVELAIARSTRRKGDEEQLVLGALALDIAEHLDGHGDDARLACSLGYVLEGVIRRSTPLTRVHARRARRLLATLAGRDWRKEPIEAEFG